ncbi:MAG: hypothetical protein M9899_05670 [Bdellovibrionaceae bacterium]|nr:hypothetical protein [Pseudobdellovibrionaceae bacterium]
MKPLFSIFILCFLTSVAAKAEVPRRHPIFGQWLTQDHKQNKKYRSIVMDAKTKQPRVYNCVRSQTEGGIELSVVVCREGAPTERFLNYNQKADKFWFSQNRLTELSVDRSGDVMYENSGVFGLVQTEWYRVYDPMVEFVYVK